MTCFRPYNNTHDFQNPVVEKNTNGQLQVAYYFLNDSAEINYSRGGTATSFMGSTEGGASPLAHSNGLVATSNPVYKPKCIGSHRLGKAFIGYHI